MVVGISEQKLCPKAESTSGSKDEQPTLHRRWRPQDKAVKCARYNSRMDTKALVAAIDQEIENLQKARSLLTDHTAPLKRGRPPAKKSTMSAEGRARIAAAQKARWAKLKRA